MARLLAALPPEQAALTTEAIATCARRGVRLYAVGGAVRDILLGRPVFDVDLVIEGPAVEIAREVGRRTKSRIVVYERFGTAALLTASGRVDVVTARRERYPHPGALPVVEPSTIADDLARRDFTINAMALPLWPASRSLLDPHDGRKDLRSRLVRVLHDGSFRDDATRALRAARYATRLGFAMERHTVDLLRRDAGYLQRISPARLRREFRRIFEDERPEEALAFADEAGLLRVLRCQLAWPGAPEGAFRRARGWAVPLDAFGFCLLLWTADHSGVRRAIRRLSLPSAIVHDVRGLHDLAESPVLTRPSVAPGAVARLLDAAPPAAVAAAAFVLPDEIARARCVRYLDEWRFVRPDLHGDALAVMGLEGAAIGETLRALRDARLDGVVRSREDEERFVRERLARRRGAAAPGA